MALSMVRWGAIDTSARIVNYGNILLLADFFTEFRGFADNSKPKQQTNPRNITQVLTLNLVVRART